MHVRYKNGDLDPSIFISPSCVNQSTKEWVVNHSELPFRHIIEYQEYLLQDENRTDAETATTTTTTTTNNTEEENQEQNQHVSQNMEEVNEWYYLGENSEVFGAFSLTQMIAWYKGGHLPITLSVRKGSEGDGNDGYGQFVKLESVHEIVHSVDKYVKCNDWYYWAEGGCQGPFTHAQMSVWLSHGYFENDLLVKKGNGNRNDAVVDGDEKEEDYVPLSTYLGVDFSVDTCM